MNKREFLKLLGFGTVAAFLPTPYLVYPRTKTSYRLSIGRILVASYPNVLKEQKQGRAWVNRSLQVLEDQKRIRHTSLAPTVEVGRINGESLTFHVSEISVPIVWSEKDEQVANTENKKIDLVATLLENGLDSHDDIFLDRMGDSHAIVSKEYQYGLGEVFSICDEEGKLIGHQVNIYTAVAFIPKGML